MAEHLSPLDATFLELEEADPTAHMHIGAVMVFSPSSGRTPRLADLRRLLERRLGALPRYRCRLSKTRTGGLGWPSWEPDPDFDAGDHLKHAALPAPGGDAELLDWAAEYWSARLDRSRPLWEATLVEGLEGGRWALATKTHHSLVDGVGAVDVGHLLLDDSPRQRQRPVPLEAGANASGPEPALLRRLSGAVVGGIRSGFDTALHPSKLREALSRSRAMVELLLRDEVMAAPQSSLNGPIGTSRRFAAVRTDLDALKAIKGSLGGTVNDVVLAAAAGGFRHLLLERGEEPPSAGLRAMVPVNVRAASEQLALGNKITSLFVHLPVAEPDPLRRYRLTMGEAEQLKSGTQAAGSATLVSLTGLAPPVLHSFMARSLFASRLFNVTITNVPGPQQPLYAFGSRLEEVLPLVPLAADHAIGVAVVSYAGNVVFGLNADHRSVPDLAALGDGIAASLDELRRLAAGHRSRDRRGRRREAGVR